jgi:hypothetical protein
MPMPDIGHRRGAPEASAEARHPIAETAAPGVEQLRARLLLALQRTAGNHAVSRMLGRAVRVGGGATKVDEAYYTTGAGKAIGSKRRVSALIGDPRRRVFTDASELESYANGKTDHIGDVVTGSAGTFWYRLPKNNLTVLGEEHHSPDGNVPDVIKGFGTSRFMYEPFNELTPTKGLAVPTPGTQARLDEANKHIEVAGQVDRKLFNPDLENIVIKALTGTQIARNEYIPKSKADRAKKPWTARKNTGEYSFGERVALYFAMAIHIGADLAKHDFGKASAAESAYVKSARQLKAVFVANQKALETFMTTKDKDDLIAIYELTKAGSFANIPAIRDFAVSFHRYGTRYIQQLGKDLGSKELEAEGAKLEKNPGAGLDDMSPAREEIMWQKIAGASGYLLVGMGDAHRVNLAGKLGKAGIAHAFVADDLERQKKDIDAKWKA